MFGATVFQVLHAVESKHSFAQFYNYEQRQELEEGRARSESETERGRTVVSEELSNCYNNVFGNLLAFLCLDSLTAACSEQNRGKKCVNELFCNSAHMSSANGFPEKGEETA